VNNNILEKSGSWFSYKSERIGQGRENARQFLKDNKDVMAKLDAEVRKALGLTAAAPATPAGSGNGRVATMPPPEAVKAPIVAAKR
jgi:recombination protein RecA